MSEHCNINEYWKKIREHDHSAMLRVEAAGQPIFHGNDAFLISFNEKSVEHFQTYTHLRTSLAKRQITPYFAPPWCSFNDGSLLWTAGSKPSFFLRLFHTLLGLRIDWALMLMLHGYRVGKVRASEMQLFSIHALNRRTLREEEELSAQMVALQQKTADQMVIGFRKERPDQALGDHARAVARLLEKADTLRIATLKELVGILEPLQALDLLVGSRKIHEFVHHFGRTRDLQHL